MVFKTRPNQLFLSYDQFLCKTILFDFVYKFEIERLIPFCKI
ncbi:hypothetical protein LEP1GSC172_2173 [Leptospira noguchii]|uniref:Uncharacterized protein n=2 Tax=Leptospira noguchii TaxID=28182 RepID=T0GT24_9LEPT|nr:hypothetical protein LEP1GSC172_2173 [Leptospira noguchii]EQA72067.1 hypothetical protein LEP1GSC059_4262 [Leptospira noguchii serovar Panama str. CZ214]